MHFGNGMDWSLNTIANIAGGQATINQVINLTGAGQKSKGVIGWATFDDAVVINPDKKIESISTELGSGALINLYKLISQENARYKVEYDYMPINYQTGNYDMNLNSSKVERN
jgi:hypothetical protein